MRFLMISYPSPTAGPPSPPSPEFIAEIDRLVASERKAGILIETGGLLPPSMGGARVKSAGGKFTVIDGPFTESKELIAGFAIVEVKSLEEAIDVSRRFFKVVGDGEGEIRQIN
jgi:hypothetical protein